MHRYAVAHNDISLVSGRTERGQQGYNGGNPPFHWFELDVKSCNG
jgi:hypothetical protein